MDKKTPSTKTGRPRRKLDARVLKRVREWLVDEEKPLSFVLDQLGFTVSQWAKLQETDAALADVLAFVKLREEERFVDTLKKANGPVGAIFALKARHQYVDKPAPTKDEERKTFITVVLPQPAKSDAEYARIVDADFREVPALPAPAADAAPEAHRPRLPDDDDGLADLV
jgi:hypothetical protein